MKQDIYEAIAGNIIPAKLVIQDHGVQEEGTVVVIIGGVEHAAPERSSQVGNVAVIFPHVSYENRIVQFRKAEMERR